MSKLKRIVLVGGGHAHVQLVKTLNYRARPSDVHVTLIDQQCKASYSGMVPGCVSNLYSIDQAQINIEDLSKWAGTEFVLGKVVGMSYGEEKKTVTVISEKQGHQGITNSKKEIPFDVISFDIGSQARDFTTIDGAMKYTIPTRPISELVLRIQKEEERLRNNELPKGAGQVVVVGAGAAGVELSLALRARWNGLLNGKLSVTLVNLNDSLFPDESQACQEALKQVMQKYNINVLHNCSVEKVTSTHVIINSDGKSSRGIEYTHCIWATGAECQQLSRDLKDQIGLELSDRGWILVNEHLQSVSHPAFFAAGDCCHIVSNNMGFKSPPKAGVYAVRSGPILIENITRFLNGRNLVNYEPQDNFLKLLMCGDGTALGFRFGLAIYGKWVWQLKDFIDRMFMNLFDVSLLPNLEDNVERNSYDTSQYDQFENSQKIESPAEAATLLLRTDDDVDYKKNWSIIREMMADELYKQQVLSETKRMKSEIL